MKKYFFYLLSAMFIFSMPMQAQERQQKETLQNRESKKNASTGTSKELRGFGGFISEISFLPEKPAASAGLGAAFLFNQAFLGIYGLAQQHNNYGRFDNKWYDASFSHGGLWFGYIHKPEKLLHLNFNMKVGGGTIALGKWKEHGSYPFNDNKRAVLMDNVVVITPQIDLELNILEWLKLGFGFGYRYVGGIEYNVYSPRDFSTPVFGMNIMAGTF